MEIPRPKPTQAAICDLAFAAERDAWNLVAGRLPGQAGFNPLRWNAWLEAVRKAAEAARLGTTITDDPGSAPKNKLGSDSN